MPEVFFIFEMNQVNTITCETSTKMEIFKSNGSQLAHDVLQKLVFGCLLVTTSDNVQATLLQRCVFGVNFPTRY